MTDSSVKVGIVGISGYSGRELLRLMLDHPKAELVYVSANTTEGPVGDIWPEFAGRTDLVCKPYDPAEAAAAGLIFLATPHTVSMKLAPGLLERGVRVIDMSGDFRLADAKEYTRWYAADRHEAPHLLDDAVYGLPELYAEQIKGARLVANPGCYPTAGILSVAPVAQKGVSGIHIDAKSGVSGAGVSKADKLLGQMKDNFKAYKVLAHQHSPEITEQLSYLAGKELPVAFVPHLLPFERGIFATVYISLDKPMTQPQAQETFERFYRDAPFVKVLPPDADLEIRGVVGTNDAQVQVSADPKQKLLVVTTVIDNLIKGASGQAVQNFNLIYGFDQTAGLK